MPGTSTFDPQVVVHLYRGELRRSDIWRTRLDTTTNWTLASAMAIVSFAFSSPHIPADLVLLGILFATSFLFIETRRYRYYDLWIRRVRLLEDGFLVPMLRGEPPDLDAARELAAALAAPAFGISWVAALGLRLHRSYAVIVFLLVLAYLIKLHSHPTSVDSLRVLVGRATIGPIQGGYIMASLGAYLLVMLAFLAFSRISAQPPGELRSRPRRRRSMAEVFAR